MHFIDTVDLIDIFFKVKHIIFFHYRGKFQPICINGDIMPRTNQRYLINMKILLISNEIINNFTQFISYKDAHQKVSCIKSNKKIV